QEGDPFDPLFYLDGENPAEGVYQVDDDWFLDQITTRMPERVEFTWHGRRYQAPVPAGATLPAFVRVVDGVVEPPPGDLVLVLRRKPRLLDLFRTAPPTFEGEATATTIFQA
ncbi:MAG: hypothetical protein ACREMH_01610, partial [Gemmatimonadales bacterium]